MADLGPHGQLGDGHEGHAQRVAGEACGQDGNDRPEQQRQKTLIVGTLTGITAVILTALSFVSFYATREITWPRNHVLTIKVTGQQWWWQLEYQNEDLPQVITTASPS